jgi:flagellar secretion chaperone FliS
MNLFAPQPRRAASMYSTINVESGVPNASPHQLILMLFDGAIQAVAAAQALCESGKIEEKNLQTSKALRIIEEGLRAALDREAGGELATRLDSLYLYMNKRLLSASLRNAIDEYAEVGRLLNEIRSGWVGIGSMPMARAA